MVQMYQCIFPGTFLILRFALIYQ